MPLTDAQCRTAMPGSRLEKLSDGGGLQFWGTAHRHPPLAAGISLQRKAEVASAWWLPERLARPGSPNSDDAKRLLANGVDPAAERKRLTREHAAAVTFQRLRTSIVQAEAREAC